MEANLKACRVGQGNRGYHIWITDVPARVHGYTLTRPALALLGEKQMGKNNSPGVLP